MPRGVYIRKPRPTCTVEGCESPNKTHGLCNMHYKRWVAHGDTDWYSPRHGQTRRGHRSPTWLSWQAMRDRCTRPGNKRWAEYGGRGITYCERWQIFENFFADMGERPEGKTLDRIDVNGPYEPANCRWATILEQRANRRPDHRTVNRTNSSQSSGQSTQ